jgi:hypothetical protein
VDENWLPGCDITERLPVLHLDILPTHGFKLDIGGDAPSAIRHPPATVPDFRYDPRRPLGVARFLATICIHKRLSP